MQYRKKPVVIEAVLCKDIVMAAKNSWKDLPEWLVKVYEQGGVVFTDKGIHLPTLEGTMFAYPQDMIICGVNGEVYPCKPDIFEKTYEACVEPPAKGLN